MPQTFKDDQGRLIVVMDGQTPEEAMAAVQGGKPSANQGGVEASAPTPFGGLTQGASGEETVRNFGNLSFTNDLLPLLGKIAEFGVGATPLRGVSVPAAAGLRMLMSGATGAATGAVDPESTAMGRGLGNAVLQGAGEGIGAAAPFLGNLTGLALGGAKNPVKAAQAFGRQGARQFPRRRIPVGAPKRTDVRIGKIGSRLGEIEEAAGPERVIDLPDAVTGSIDDLTPAHVVQRSADPEKLVSGANDRGMDFLTQRENVGLPASLNVREAGELKRGMTQEASNLFAQAEKGVRNVPGTDVEAEFAKALGSRLRAAQEAVEPGVVPLNEELADLFSMQAANRQLRGGGGVITTPGQMGVRGGPPAAIGAGLASATGAMSPALAGVLGSLGGIIGLAPTVTSRAGNIAGRVGGAIPSSVRLANIIKELQDLQGPSEGGDRVRLRQVRE